MLIRACLRVYSWFLFPALYAIVLARWMRDSRRRDSSVPFAGRSGYDGYHSPTGQASYLASAYKAFQKHSLSNQVCQNTIRLANQRGSIRGVRIKPSENMTLVESFGSRSSQRSLTIRLVGAATADDW